MRCTALRIGLVSDQRSAKIGEGAISDSIHQSHYLPKYGNTTVALGNVLLVSVANVGKMAYASTVRLTALCFV